MEKIKCRYCKGSLSPSEINKNATVCHLCFSKFRVEKIQTEEFINQNLLKVWSKRLFKDYIIYLVDMGINYDTIRKHTSKVLKIFQNAEQNFLKPEDIHEEWFFNIIINYKEVKSSLYRFLNKEGLLIINQESVIHKSIIKSIEQVPKEYRRLLEIYLNEKIKLRSRQNKFNARKPLALRTIESDMQVFIRLVKWLDYNKQQIKAWDSIQQEDIHEYLLTLKPKHREIVRKELLVLFKLAKRKRLITHIPLLDIKSRELPPSIEALSFQEQAKVGKLIKFYSYDKPLESLLTTLCFYHGLSSTNISNIKLADVSVERKMILMEERPPVYLSDDELISLCEYLKHRKIVKNVENKTFLFISSSNSEVYHNRPVSNRFILKKVKEFCGYTPKTLRITCFNVLASYFGPQILIDGFGLSLTQSSRYGKLEDYLIDDEIINQRITFKK